MLLLLILLFKKGVNKMRSTESLFIARQSDWVYFVSHDVMTQCHHHYPSKKAQRRTDELNS